MVTDATAVMASRHVNVSHEPHCIPQTYTRSCVPHLNKAEKKKKCPVFSGFPVRRQSDVMPVQELILKKLCILSLYPLETYYGLMKKPGLENWVTRDHGLRAAQTVSGHSRVRGHCGCSPSGGASHVLQPVTEPTAASDQGKYVVPNPKRLVITLGH